MNVCNELKRVEMALKDVFYLSYAVRASKLRALVPEMLPLAVVDENMAFVSIVILQSIDVRLHALPFPRFTYNQVNLRTYVIDPLSGKQAVYFLKSGVTSLFVSRLTRTLGIPWQHINVDIKTQIDEGTRYSFYEASGVWKEEFQIVAYETHGQPIKLAPFKDRESAVDYLVRPLIGFIGDYNRLRRFTIRHPEVKPHSGNLRSLNAPFLNSLGILDEAEMEKPHSVLFVPEAQFYIYMPPRRIR